MFIEVTISTSSSQRMFSEWCPCWASGLLHSLSNWAVAWHGTRKPVKITTASATVDYQLPQGLARYGTCILTLAWAKVMWLCKNINNWIVALTTWWPPTADLLQQGGRSDASGTGAFAHAAGDPPPAVIIHNRSPLRTLSAGTHRLYWTQAEQQSASKQCFDVEF